MEPQPPRGNGSSVRGLIAEAELRLRDWFNERMKSLVTSYEFNALQDRLDSLTGRMERWFKRIEDDQREFEKEVRERFDRLDNRLLDEPRVTEISRRAVEKAETETWTGWQRVMLMVSLFATIITTVISLILFLTR